MAGRKHKPYPIVVRDLEVVDAFDVTPSMRRVILGGDQLGPFVNNGYRIEAFRTENADDHVKIVIPDPDDAVQPPAQDDGHLDWTPESIARARDYTPRRYDPRRHRLEVDFVLHSGGLAAEWAAATKPGDRVHVAGPRGTTVLPDDIDWYFLVGDETALPAIARRIEELADGTPVTAVVSIPSPADEQPLSHTADLHLTWVHRDRTDENALLAAVSRAPWREGQVYAWAAGEAAMLRPIRRWLRDERQVDRAHTDIAGYWRAGHTQHEMSTSLQDLRRNVGLALPYALRAAVTLGLAEAIADGHRDVASLAEATGAQTRGLHKLLRLLAHEGYLTLAMDDKVDLTPRGTVLTEEIVHAHLDRASGYAHLDDGWPGLLEALRTGRPGYEAATGVTFWDTIGSDPELGQTFDGSLADWSMQWSRSVVESLDLDDDHVVDVGGGTGTLMTSILQAHPRARGTLVELPTTAERARRHFSDHDVDQRVTIRAQSFFESLPAGGDRYLLAQVLHDWPDAEAVNILRRVAEAAGDAPILIIERLPSADDHDHDIVFDLLMYTVFAGGERTAAAYASLAGSAGLSLARTTPLVDDLHLLELHRSTLPGD